MGSDSETRLAEQDRLRGAENYHQWADEMDNILVSKGLGTFIDPKKTRPEELKEPEDESSDTTAEAARRAARRTEIATWNSNNAKTLVAIQQNITQQPKDLVRGIKTASAMWAKLKKYYEGKGQSLKSQYLAEIQELDYSSNKKKKKKKDKDNKEKFDGNCNHCQKYGHKAKDCWIKHPEKKPKKEPAAALASSGLTMYAEAAMVSNAFENCWLVDTSANYHLCHDQALFQTYTKSGTLPMFNTANGMTRAIGYGSVTIEVEHPDGTTFPLKLKDVYHLPSLPINILSGTVIEKYGFYLCCDTHTIRSKSTKEELIAIDVIDHKLLLRQKNALVCSAVSINTWHRRLGHIGIDNIKKTAKITEGMDIDSDTELEKPCDPCEIGKSLRTVSRKPQDRPEHVGDMIHVDVVGPISPVGFNGHRWGILITDGSTRARWGYTFKHKDEASAFLRRFIVDMKTHNQ